MSHRLVSEVLHNAPEDLSALERLVLVCLAEAAHPTDRQARAGSSTTVLAHKAATTEGTVRNVLTRLRDRGLIVALVDRPNRGRGQNYYLPQLEPHHRKASPRSDANEVPVAPPIASPTNDANANGKRHSTVTHKPVDNSPAAAHA